MKHPTKIPPGTPVVAYLDGPRVEEEVRVLGFGELSYKIPRRGKTRFARVELPGVLWAWHWECSWCSFDRWPTVRRGRPIRYVTLPRWHRLQSVLDARPECAWKSSCSNPAGSLDHPQRCQVCSDEIRRRRLARPRKGPRP